MAFCNSCSTNKIRILLDRKMYHKRDARVKDCSGYPFERYEQKDKSGKPDPPLGEETPKA